MGFVAVQPNGCESFIYFGGGSWSTNIWNIYLFIIFNFRKYDKSEKV
jgi:hypothetical protein